MFYIQCWFVVCLFVLQFLHHHLLLTYQILGHYIKLEKNEEREGVKRILFYSPLFTRRKKNGMETVDTKIQYKISEILH